jgi:D-alanyl-D-alanine dipeptidase
MVDRGELAGAMHCHGFRPYEKEWWHFTLSREPFPKTYFDFPVR